MTFDALFALLLRCNGCRHRALARCQANACGKTPRRDSRVLCAAVRSRKMIAMSFMPLIDAHTFRILAASVGKVG